MLITLLERVVVGGFGVDEVEVKFSKKVFGVGRCSGWFRFELGGGLRNVEGIVGGIWGVCSVWVVV